MTMRYAELASLVKSRELLARQYGYYVFIILFALLFLVGFAALLFTAAGMWLQLLAVAGIVFALMQFGFLTHDAGHKAIFRSDRWNNVAGHFFSDVFLGVGFSYWVNKHNMHHANPNDEERDPDFSALFALSEKEAMRRRGLYALLTQWQHFLFVPFAGTYFLGMQFLSLRYNRQQGFSLRTFAEWMLLALHTVLIWLVPMFFFPVWASLLFSFLVRFWMGVYFGSVVAANHKGMPVVHEEDRLTFVEKQVVTTRNVTGGVLTDYVYGGLNHQIQHHLFPTMPRNNLGKCKALVQRFCRENRLEYSEAGVLQSSKLITAELRRIAVWLQKQKKHAGAGMVAVRDTVSRS